MRVLLAKPGLDGHDRGVKVVGMALREAGCEVIYIGLRQSADSIWAAAVQEDVDLVGVSILSGTHVSFLTKLLRDRRHRALDDIPVVVGGTIPQGDVGTLRDLGVADVFPVGSDIESVTSAVVSIMADRKRVAHE